MWHSGRLLAALLLLAVVTALVEDGANIEEELVYSPEERKAHDRLKATAIHPVQSREHQTILDEVEAALVGLYDEGRGDVNEKSLLLLGDLAKRAVSENVVDEQGVVQHKDLMNQAGIYYEDAFEKHNSTEGYFRLAKVIESMANMQATIGNDTHKDHLIDQANKMFLVCGSKGHIGALRSLTENCEQNHGFGEDGCPEAIKIQARMFNEEILKQSPNDPLILGKLAIFWAQGFGVKQPDLPKACEYAEEAAKANADILAATGIHAPRKGITKEEKDKEFELMGYNTNNYILHGNCKYFNDFQSTGDAAARADGRDILRKGMSMRLLGKDELETLESHLMSMVGPEEEPTYSGSIEWTSSRDGLGDMWFVYIWVSLSKGFFWSPRLRLGDMSLKVTHKGEGLVDFSGEDPPLSLEAEKFQPPADGSLGQLRGKARRQMGEDSFVEGTFTFTVVPQVPRSEL